MSNFQSKSPRMEANRSVLDCAPSKMWETAPHGQSSRPELNLWMGDFLIWTPFASKLTGHRSTSEQSKLWQNAAHLTASVRGLRSCPRSSRRLRPASNDRERFRVARWGSL